MGTKTPKTANALTAEALDPHVGAFDAAKWLALCPRGVPAPTPKQYECLVYEAALGYFDETRLAQRFRLPLPVLRALQASPSFRADVLEKQREQDEGQDSLRVRARRSLRAAMDELDTIIRDPEIPSGLRIKAIKEVREVAGLAASTSAIPPPSASPALQVVTNLNMRSDQSPGTYTIEVRDIASEPKPGETVRDSIESLL